MELRRKVDLGITDPNNGASGADKNIHLLEELENYDPTVTSKHWYRVPLPSYITGEMYTNEVFRIIGIFYYIDIKASKH